MDTNMVQDKTCRICGYVDKNNINIFDERYGNLLKQILTVYPVVIYKSDPLPKNICKKCYARVILMYDECQKLLKNQKKWTDNVRSNQPGHPYVSVLDTLEKSNREMVRTIRDIAPEFPDLELRTLLTVRQLDEIIDNNKNLTMRRNFSTIPLIIGNSNNSNEEDLKKNQLKTNTKCENKKRKQSSDQTSNLISSKKLQDDIESKRRKICVTNSIILTDNKNSNLKIKEVKNKLKSNELTLQKISSNKFQGLNNKQIKCIVCSEIFPNIHFLAIHQAQHLFIKVRKIFKQKFLVENLRRSFLLKVNDKKFVKCLNCSKVFFHDRAILEHWSSKNCDFFCQICGKEFPTNPKLLREHVLAIHNINYKSSRPPIVNNVTQKIVIRNIFNKTFGTISPQLLGKCIQSKNDIIEYKNKNIQKKIKLNTSSDKNKLLNSNNTGTSIINKPRIKVKRLSDLQNPISILPNNGGKSSTSYCNLYNDNRLNNSYSSIQYKTRTRYVCRFCLRSFCTFNEIQMHLILIHKNCL